MDSMAKPGCLEIHNNSCRPLYLTHPCTGHDQSIIASKSGYHGSRKIISNNNLPTNLIILPIKKMIFRNNISARPVFNTIYAFSRSAMINFFIFNSAFMALCPRCGSVISLPSPFGMICQLTPKRSFSQPH